MSVRTSLSVAARDAKSGGRRRGVSFTSLVLFGISALGIVLAAAYISAAIFLRTNPPIVAVAGRSMYPALQNGDLLVLGPVDPRRLRIGDVVALQVPDTSQDGYNLPSQVVHRIVKIEDGTTGLLFTTKGDANSGPDVFVTRDNGIVGRPIARVPGVGYPILFARSKQGGVFGTATLAVLILYFLLGLIDDWRRYVRSTTQVVRSLSSGAGAAAGGWGRRDELRAVAQEVRQSTSRSKDVDTTMRELVLAVGEYGTHLQSHTAVMQNLAATTAELRGAVVDMRRHGDAAVTEGPQGAIERTTLFGFPTASGAIERSAIGEGEQWAPIDGDGAAPSAFDAIESLIARARLETASPARRPERSNATRSDRPSEMTGSSPIAALVAELQATIDATALRMTAHRDTLD